MIQFPLIDASRQDALTETQVQFFRDNGLLIIHNVLDQPELRLLQAQTAAAVQKAVSLTPSLDYYQSIVTQQNGNAFVSQADPQSPDQKDYLYQLHKLTRQVVPFRIEYIIDKISACRALLAHPFILNSVQQIQGPNFIPTWDSMVFKQTGAGAPIPWHRDDDAPCTHQSDTPIFNVDFYLDGSDLTNCLWGILGSNRWSSEQASQKIRQLNEGGFKTDDTCLPIPMNPGDVIFHNIHALHGSPAAQSQLRRVIYYEFRPIEVELQHGPHSPAYLPAKQQLLRQCLQDRTQAPYARNERPFAYAPDTILPYRWPHEAFWRTISSAH